jgi:hypothetical protein
MKMGGSEHDQCDDIVEFSQQKELYPSHHRPTQNEVLAQINGLNPAIKLLEAQCIKIFEEEVSYAVTTIQWEASLRLFNHLLYEYHDFLLALSHPAVSPELRVFAEVYDMPTRLCRRGIMDVLEYMRLRLPLSREPIQTFLHGSYHLLGLLEETTEVSRMTLAACRADVARHL